MRLTCCPCCPVSRPRCTGWRRSARWGSRISPASPPWAARGAAGARGDGKGTALSPRCPAAPGSGGGGWVCGGRPCWGWRRPGGCPTHWRGRAASPPGPGWGSLALPGEPSRSEMEFQLRPRIYLYRFPFLVFGESSVCGVGINRSSRF